MRPLSLSITCACLALSLANASALDISRQLITIDLQSKEIPLTEDHQSVVSLDFVLTVSPTQITAEQLEFRYISITPLEITDEPESIADLAQMTLSAGRTNPRKISSEQLSKAISALRLHAGSEILAEVTSIYFNGENWRFDILSKEPGGGGVYRVTSEGTVSFENDNR